MRRRNAPAPAAPSPFDSLFLLDLFSAGFMLRLCHTSLVFALAGLLLTGCRTYGDDYGTTPKTHAALQGAVSSFEEDLRRAEADLQRLQEAADQVDTLRVLADAYADLVERHRSLLQTQRTRARRFSAEAGYRSLHTAYGATVTEQRMQEKRYRQAVQRVRAVVQGSASVQASAQEAPRRYMIRPMNFPEADGKRELTMRAALSGR